MNIKNKSVLITTPRRWRSDRINTAKLGGTIYANGISGKEKAVTLVML